MVLGARTGSCGIHLVLQRYVRAAVPTAGIPRERSMIRSLRRCQRDELSLAPECLLIVGSRARVRT